MASRNQRSSVHRAKPGFFRNVLRAYRRSRNNDDEFINVLRGPHSRITIMKRNAVCLAIVLLLLAACTAKTATPENQNPNQKPPGGTWSGDYGPDSYRREPIKVELRWEGSNLRGTIQAGVRDLEIKKASFKPETGAITMEFDAQGNNGQTLHYKIDGKVEGNVMKGTWSHDDQRGDFRVSRQ
ncbi:MAG: hypothetical protein DMG11_27425 [Acidobacteria bacterium]|nr:MAG: hypothetical protein DMG11_27425 [Acidobacteriota bacterium]